MLLLLGADARQALSGTVAADVPSLGDPPQYTDRSVDPRHDFCRYAAGNWLDKTEIGPSGADVRDERPGHAGPIGWGLSLADTARPGLVHTVYRGKGRFERGSMRWRQHIVPLSADDCLALLK